MKLAENMKFTIVQVGKQFICLTPAETVKPVPQKEKTALPEFQISFGTPFICPIEDDNLKGHIMDFPKELAEAVKDGMRQMQFETRDVYLCVEGPEVLSQEYKHAPAKSKFLDNIAKLEAKALITDGIENYSVIRCEYDKDHNKTVANAEGSSEDCTASLFAMPRAQIKDLKAEFEKQCMKIVKLIPPQAAMIKAANEAVTSFDKVVALFSMDFVAIRLLVVQNGKPLFCHSFPSPMGDIAEVVSKDKNLKFAEAMDYIRRNGMGLAEQSNFPQNGAKITELLETSASYILRNMRMVLLSGRMDLNQIYLCDSIGVMPGTIKFLRQMGFTSDINIISDSFLPSSNVPFVQALADSKGYKAACFFTFTYLINSDSPVKNNLLCGINEKRESDYKLANTATMVLGIVAVLAMAFIGWQSVSLELQKNNDTTNLALPKYDEAKSLIEQREDLMVKNDSIEVDKANLPTAPVTAYDIMTNVFDEVTKKVESVTSYSLAHKDNKLALSFKIKGLDSYVNLKNSIEDEDYFSIATPFTASGDEETKVYDCTVTLSVKELEAATNAQAQSTADAKAKSESQQAKTGGNN